jgi:two-component system, NtrC family, response regulator GlrR
VSRFLLVEDHDPIRMLMTEMLTRAGHEVVAVGSAEAALVELEAGGDTEALITDARLPGLSGFELIEWVASHDSQLPKLIVTGGAAKHDIDRARSLGASVLLKPFDEKSLLAAVSNLMLADE